VSADFWNRYVGLRALALGYPLELDEASLGDATRGLRTWLGLDAAAASYQASRRLLLRRDAALHELLARELPPADLTALLDSVAVEGMEHLRGPQASGGVLFLSLHYSLYASLLVLWLARAASRGLFSQLAVLYWATPGGAPDTFLEAMRRSEDAGFIPSSTIVLIDLGEGSVRATRKLMSTLESGGAALIFSDRLTQPGVDRRSVTVTIGHRQVGIARGVPWLAGTAGCPVVPVHVRPHEDNRHAIVFGAPLCIGVDGDASAVIQAGMQYLLDRAVLVDPGPWDGWASLGRLTAETEAR
jgi:lauroyl/myristoyl acyltransferase